MKLVKVVLSPEAEEAYKQLNAIAANSKLERSILEKPVMAIIFDSEFFTRASRSMSLANNGLFLA